MNGLNSDSSKSTIFATAFPAPGMEPQWEQAIGELIRASSTFPGYQGSIVLRPDSPEQPHYRVITRFDTTANMRRWYDSDQRREKISHLEPLQRQPAEIQHLTGFETWFTPPADSLTATAPPKCKMFVIVWFAVYATVLPVIAILKPWTTSLPSLLASALLAAITVAMMTWIVLPFLTWLFKAWLYPHRQEQ
ncbi:hypothetical protein CKO51_28300 [Rhodopirellula sp. SM50]|nr:antibiotic biosynthesis monooxygenase [Rhodopirellula sp. SM50]PAY16108.1 hypothetical protein CKO51_28300 [Rhodopirellula sp. SM50]